MGSEGTGDRPVLLVLLKHIAVKSQYVGRAGQRFPMHVFSFLLPPKVVLLLLQAFYFCSWLPHLFISCLFIP